MDGTEMPAKERDHRKPLPERLPEHIFHRIHEDIGQASMCWEHVEKAGVFDATKAIDISFELCHFIADMIQDATIGKEQEIESTKRDKLKEFEKIASILPLRISKTGNPNEPLIEIILCTAISGGGDYIDEMPRRLTLHRELANGKKYAASYMRMSEAD